MRADSGTVRFDGEAINTNDKAQLFRLRRRLGMLFQFGALFTDLTVLDNVAFPLREMTDLPEELIRNIVLMKLNAVGLARRGQFAHQRSVWRHGPARGLGPSHCAGPRVDHVRRAVCRSRSGVHGRGRQADPHPDRCDGRDDLLISHDIPQCMAISDAVVLLAPGGRIVAQGTPAELMASDDPETRQFVRGEPDGPVKFHYPAPTLEEDFGARASA